MAVTNFTPLLGLALPTTGDLSGTWGTTVNDAITDLLDDAVAGTVTLSTDADVTLTTTNGANNQARNAVLLCTGARTTLKTITAPAQSKAYIVINATTGGFSVKVVGSGPTTPGVTVANGEKALIAWNGSDFVLISKSVIDLTADVKGILPVVNGGTGLSSGTSGGVLAYTASGTLASSAALTQFGVVYGGGAGAVPVATAAGTTGQVLTATTGGAPNWAVPAAGGITYTTVKTANYTAVANDGVQTNTTAGAFTVTLPATPSNGTQVFVVDSFNTWGTNNLTIGRNGSTIEGIAQDLVCDITGVSVQCVYNGTTWDIFAQVGGAGGSVVSGPASSTANGVALFDGTTGKLLKDSSATDGLIHGLTLGRGPGAVSTNTVLGTSAYRLNTTGSNSVVVGNQAGYTNSTGIQNVFIGNQAGYAATGQDSTFVGTGAGGAITSGTNNTIIGQYDGNGDGLDIRTASNYAVISDGDGNRLLSTANGYSLALDGGAVPQTGTGITFPATQLASSNANTLDDYEEGSFTFTGTGFTTSPTDTAYYTKIGNQVTVQIPDITGTSNTTAMTITGLPVALRSAQAYVFFAIVYNASVAYNGYIYGAHDNAVTVYWNAVSDAFTASGVKGITNNLSITYTLA